MTMNNKIENPCSFGGEMLAYLYDELSSDGRERFETHLQGCVICIEEFAELSEARYSVYEWRNVEFAPLATPRFAVPVQTAPVGASWLDSFRAAFSWNGAAAVAGGIAVLVVGVFGVVLLQNSPDGPVAANVQRPAGPNAAAPVSPSAAYDEKASVEAPEVGRPELMPAAPRRSERDTVAVRSQPATTEAKRLRRPPAETVQTRRATTTRRLDGSPTLGQYVEDRDESLRLSDLFDDLDSRELD